MISSNVLSKIPEHKLTPTLKVQETAQRRGLKIVKHRDSGHCLQEKEASPGNLKNSIA